MHDKEMAHGIALMFSLFQFGTAACDEPAQYSAYHHSEPTPSPAPEVVVPQSSQTFAGSYYNPPSSTHNVTAPHNQPHALFAASQPLPVIPDEEEAPEPEANVNMAAATELYPPHSSPRVRRHYDVVPGQEDEAPPAINRTSKPHSVSHHGAPSPSNQNGDHTLHVAPRRPVPLPPHKPSVDYSKKPVIEDPIPHPTGPPVHRPAVHSAPSPTGSRHSSSEAHTPGVHIPYDKPVGRRFERSAHTTPPEHSPAAPARPDVLHVVPPHHGPADNVDHLRGNHSLYEEIHQPDPSIRTRYSEVRSHKLQAPSPETDPYGHRLDGDVESRRFRQMQPVPHQYYIDHAGGRSAELSSRGSDSNLYKDRSSSGRSFASLSSNDSQDDKLTPIRIPGRRHLTSSDSPLSDPPTPVAPLSLREASRLMPQGLVNPSYRVATMAVDVMPDTGARHSQGSSHRNRPTPSHRKGGLPSHVRHGIVQGVLYVISLQTLIQTD